jgi:hypothetical protein
VGKRAGPRRRLPPAHLPTWPAGKWRPEGGGPDAGGVVLTAGGGEGWVMGGGGICGRIA